MALERRDLACRRLAPVETTSRNRSSRSKPSPCARAELGNGTKPTGPKPSLKPGSAQEANKPVQDVGLTVDQESEVELQVPEQQFKPATATGLHHQTPHPQWCDQAA